MLYGYSEEKAGGVGSLVFIYLFIFVNSFVNSFLYSFISFLGK